MKILSLITVFLLLTIDFFGQSQESYDKLINETNNYFHTRSELHSFDLQYPVSQFDFSLKEKARLLEEANFEENLNMSKDSIDAFYMIDYFNQEIMKNVDKLVRHEKFILNKIQEELPEISIIFSKDKKLYNFSFEENTGGSYLSRVSKMYFFNDKTNKTIDLSDYSYINPDGYNDIYTLETNGITKYLLIGNVRGCTTCFENYIQLINARLEEKFSYSTNSRAWTDGIDYDNKTKTFDVYYNLDDITTSCYCENEIEYKSDSIINLYETPLICRCRFVYNGETFVMTEGRLNKE